MSETPTNTTADVVPFPQPVRPDGARPRVLAVANQKGGVGKTTTAINLGTALAAIGEHVLVVDLDPQGNASTGLGIERKARHVSTYDVLTGKAPLRAACCRPRCRSSTSRLRPWTSPASSWRSAASATAPSACAPRSPTLNKGAAQLRLTRYVLVDCPPSLNLLTVNAMAAADSILVPLQCEFFALEGLSQL